MQEMIRKMLSGEISMKEFLDFADENPDLVSCIDSLIPQDAINHPEHPVWSKICYQAYKNYGFSIWNLLKSVARFDSSAGSDYEIASTIGDFYCFECPDFQPTSKYREKFILLLEVSGDYYGGPEVDKLIDDLISEYVDVNPKTLRKRQAKNAMNQAFHITDKKRPYWIQGAEWPMGKNSPMKFVESKRIPDGKKYFFADVDTGEMREIVQFY